MSPAISARERQREARRDRMVSDTDHEGLGFVLNEGKNKDQFRFIAEWHPCAQCYKLKRTCCVEEIYEHAKRPGCFIRAACEECKLKKIKCCVKINGQEFRVGDHFFQLMKDGSFRPDLRREGQPFRKKPQPRKAGNESAVSSNDESDDGSDTDADFAPNPDAEHRGRKRRRTRSSLERGAQTSSVAVPSSGTSPPPPPTPPRSASGAPSAPLWSPSSPPPSGPSKRYDNDRMTIGATEDLSTDGPFEHHDGSSSRPPTTLSNMNDRTTEDENAEARRLADDIVATMTPAQKRAYYKCCVDVARFIKDPSYPQGALALAMLSNSKT